MNNSEIKKFEDDVKEPIEGTVDPMTFMTPEQAEEEDKKANEFIKAFRFGTPEFFNKVKEVYEVEGINGINRLERSLDTYMAIRNMVMDEVIIDSNLRHTDDNREECESSCVEPDKEVTAITE